jgi:hypothetical protein
MMSSPDEFHIIAAFNAKRSRDVSIVREFDSALTVMPIG